MIMIEKNNSFVELVADLMIRLDQKTQNMITPLIGTRMGIQNVRFHFADKTRKVYAVLDGKFLIKTTRNEKFNETEIVKVELVK